jgi:diketogulonate reductase-like aldo/keto reductase
VELQSSAGACQTGFRGSLEKLAADYLDLYLIHTPFAFQPGDEQDPRYENGDVIYDKGVTLPDTWRAMEDLVNHGRCWAIGLSDIGLNEFQPLYCLRGRSSVVGLAHHPRKPRPARERISISPRFRQTRATRSTGLTRQRFNEVVKTGSPGFIPPSNNR